MHTAPASTTSVVGRESAQVPVSTLPRIAVTRAISASASRISGAPTSPAWRMRSDPRKASTAWRRRRPWVSEITPRVTCFSVISFSILKVMGAAGRVLSEAEGMRPSLRGPCRFITNRLLSAHRLRKYSKAILRRVPETGPNLSEALRRYWGYHEFRPKQENVIRSLLAAHDTCVVMPTGGGKSLCYQLPALISGKTAVVVSPLIALMQDQAAQLAQMGIPAAAINSFQSSAERRQVMEKAARGEYRLLYLSPEKLAAENTYDWLAKVPVGFFAVDEAHCISEWGHEFRPDYRQLSRLRTRFPETPIAAFTASATRQVRHDILKQLQMRDADKYIASFHRPNLRYVVRECDARSQPDLLVSALRSYGAGAPLGASRSGVGAPLGARRNEDGNIIVYAPTIT